jgi:hypothetical protein
MALLGYEARWKLILVHWKTTLMLTQDRCTVWAKQTMVLENHFRRSGELQGDVGHLECRFGAFRDSVSVGLR